MTAGKGPMKHPSLEPERFCLSGAVGETRTRTAFATTPSRERVYQFHHDGGMHKTSLHEVHLECLSLAGQLPILLWKKAHSLI